MEILDKKIKEFLKIEVCDGYGDGDGSGNGSGSGNGDGSGDGYGSGYGDGYGIKTINKCNIYRIDNVQTIITNVKGNIAKGKILKKDLTLEECYIAKGQNMFAHGKTMKEAVEDLRNKIISQLDVEERIEEFKNTFNKDKKYKGTEFYKWHNLLTGSCEMGRNNFVERNELDLNKKFTVKEFIDLCKNDYGGEIIKRLEENYNN